MSSAQSPPPTPPTDPQTGPRQQSWIRLNFEKVAPWIAAGAGILGVVLASVFTTISIINSIHDSYRQTVLAIERGIRADLRELRDDMREDVQALDERIDGLRCPIHGQCPDEPD